MLDVFQVAPDLDGRAPRPAIGRAVGRRAVAVGELHDDGVLLDEVQRYQRAADALEPDGVGLVHDGHSPVTVLVDLADLLLGALRPPPHGVASALDRLLVRVAAVLALFHLCT